MKIDLSTFAGNDKAKQLVAGMFENSRLPHSIIIEGVRGGGKHTFARLIAKAAVCRANSGSNEDTAVPCGVCPSCVKADAGSHPDIAEITGTGVSNNFPVEQIRTVRQNTFIVPSESDKKAALFWDTDTMSEQSQNALLTILEEPPPYALFILTCQTASALLTTVRSRAVTIALSAPDEQTAAEFAAAKRPEADAAQIKQLAHLHRGNIGSILSALDADANDTASELSAQIAQALPLEQELTLLALCAKLEKDRALARAVLSSLELIIRDSFVARHGSQTVLSAQEQAVQVLRNKLPSARLLNLLEVIRKSQRLLDQNVQGALFATFLSSALRDAAGF